MESETIAKVPFKRDPTVITNDTHLQTPIPYTTKMECTAITEMLPEEVAKLQMKDKDDRTLISDAT